MPAPLLRRILLCLAIAAPAMVFRILGLAPHPVLDLVIFGAAVVAASFMLAWAAEAAQKDISGALAIAILALIAVLPEYAVDLYYAFRSGSDPAYAQFAAANMTGSNRLLLGFGWPLVVVVALIVARRAAAARGVRGAGLPRALQLPASSRLDIGVLAIVAVLAFAIPLMQTIAVLFALRGMGTAAIGTLIASKINQWTLLVGSLPIAHYFGGGGLDLALDPRQVEEFVLTASQTVMGVAIIIALRFHRWSALALVALFAVQFVVTDTSGRYVLSAIHLGIAAVLFWVHRRDILSALAAPFRRSLPEPADDDREPQLVR